MTEPPPPPPSDDDLLSRIAAGDSSAFAALFRRRQGDVYRFALHMTGQPAIADDVTQEVFLVVMRDAGRYESGRSSVTAWLCGIARNFARRRSGADQRHQPLHDAAAGGHDVAGDAVDPVDSLDRAQRIDWLRTAILKLPIRYREVLVLCDLQEMSYAEAATALECAVGTVRSRLHRARALLAARLRASDEARLRGTRLEPRTGTRCSI